MLTRLLLSRPRRSARTAQAALLIALVLGAVACASPPPPAGNSGFLQNPERLAPMPERFPFQGVWRASGEDRDHFRSVYIRKVDVNHLLGVDWTVERPTTEHSQKVRSEANALAKYFWDESRRAFYFDPNKRLEVVDDVQSTSIILELAITRVIIGNFGHGTVGMEGRVRDGSTGEVFAIFKDERSGNRRGIIRDWTLELVELVNTPQDHQVQ